MTYEYKCNNLECAKRNEIIAIQKPMAEAGEEELCTECKEVLQKVFGSPAISTSDGYKS